MLPTETWSRVPYEYIQWSSGLTWEWGTESNGGLKENHSCPREEWEQSSNGSTVWGLFGVRARRPERLQPSESEDRAKKEVGEVTRRVLGRWGLLSIGRTWAFTLCDVDSCGRFWARRSLIDLFERSLWQLDWEKTAGGQRGEPGWSVSRAWTWPWPREKMIEAISGWGCRGRGGRRGDIWATFGV